MIVGNVSAGSWGPQNELGDVERFGLFDADVCVVVVSIHDATDEIGPLTQTIHQTSPSYHFAWSELIDRWIYHPRSGSDPANDAPGNDKPCLAAFDALLTRISHDTGRPAIVLVHYEHSEVDQENEPVGLAKFRMVCEAYAIVPVSLNVAYRAALATDEIIYVDYIHPNSAGHRVIASVMMPIIEQALMQPSTRPTGIGNPSFSN